MSLEVEFNSYNHHTEQNKKGVFMRVASFLFTSSKRIRNFFIPSNILLWNT